MIHVPSLDPHLCLGLATPSCVCVCVCVCACAMEVCEYVFTSVYNVVVSCLLFVVKCNYS